MTARRSLKLYALRFFFMKAAKPTVRLGLHYKDMYFHGRQKDVLTEKKRRRVFRFFPGAAGEGSFLLIFGAKNGTISETAFPYKKQ